MRTIRNSHVRESKVISSGESGHAWPSPRFVGPAVGLVADPSGLAFVPSRPGQNENGVAAAARRWNTTPRTPSPKAGVRVLGMR